MADQIELSEISSESVLFSADTTRDDGPYFKRMKTRALTNLRLNYYLYFKLFIMFIALLLIIVFVLLGLYVSLYSKHSLLVEASIPPQRAPSLTSNTLAVRNTDASDENKDIPVLIMPPGMKDLSQKDRFPVPSTPTKRQTTSQVKTEAVPTRVIMSNNVKHSMYVDICRTRYCTEAACNITDLGYYKVLDYTCCGCFPKDYFLKRFFVRSDKTVTMWIDINGRNPATSSEYDLASLELPQHLQGNWDIVAESDTVSHFALRDVSVIEPPVEDDD